MIIQKYYEMVQECGTVAPPPMTPDTLRTWRAARKLSRRAAASLLGISERTLEGLEYGRYAGSPLWGPIARIVQLLGD
jgi:transcriptional regulator with XRE-family HTH domain